MSKHDELKDNLDRITAKIREYEGQQKKLIDSGKAVVLAIAESEAGITPEGVKSFEVNRAKTDLVAGILESLREKCIESERALWLSDLAEAQALAKASKLKFDTARVSLNTAISDKAVYLRRVGRGAMIDENIERLASLEILISDARIVANLAERNHNIAIRDLRAMETAFNQAAERLGMQLVETPYNA